MTMDGMDPEEPTTVVSSEFEMAALDVLDHEHVEWERVRRTAFLIHQYYRYEYPGSIEDLKHRLIVVPPERHLDQRRVIYRMDVSANDAQVVTRHDAFGNLVLDVSVPRVDEAIEFEVWVVAERRNGRRAPADRKS